MARKKTLTKKDDTFITGGALAILGLYLIASNLTSFSNILSGFFMLGLGVVFVASTNEEFRKQFFDFIFSIFKDLWKSLSRSK